MSRTDPEVLVVDDESRLADLFAAWLDSDGWDVETAYGGQTALEKMSDAVEVVLLDRRMPGLSGDDVLTEIREADYDTRVVMVTAVDPDFDIIDMGFDDYLVKPVSKDELLDLVERVVNRSEYAADVQEYFALVSKRALLQVEKSKQELADNPEYQALEERINDLETRVDDRVSQLESHDDFEGAFRDLPGGSDDTA